jgi:hypothetical protein
VRVMDRPGWVAFTILVVGIFLLWVRTRGAA